MAPALPQSGTVPAHSVPRAGHAPSPPAPSPPPVEGVLEQLAEQAVVHAVLEAGGLDALRRRQFLQRLGASTFAALLAEVFPMRAARALASDEGRVEKPDLRIGFIPITCSTPVIMAEPMEFYRKNGLSARVIKASGWAVLRDLAINGEVDAAHMLTPMPLAITLGVGSRPVPFALPLVQNVNGQAITLHIKHRGVRGPQDMKGFRLAVPFDYSMHNFLLRYYLAEGGLDPDRDVQIRVVPPPEMAANLRAGNVDGYLAPDPFNQRAVYEGTGFIHLLSRDIWPGHPCCGFAVPDALVQSYPNTYRALVKAIVEACLFARDPANRPAIAEAIAPRNYLNQPVELLRQVLTGVFPDGLGNQRSVPDRIDFDPFPWHSMAVWILSQMRRWGYVQRDLDWAGVAARVFRTADCRRALQELGRTPPAADSTVHRFADGRVFDPARVDQYLASFAIRRG